MQYVGIDPGKSGAITVIEYTEVSSRSGYISTDTIIASYSFDNTDQDVYQWVSNCIDPLSAHATIEQVHAMPNQGVTSMFTFGYKYGFAIGLLNALQIPYALVTPQKWQKAMNCLSKGDKNVTKTMAQRLWPKLKITHKTADSMLIAEYGRKHVWKSA